MIPSPRAWAVKFQRHVSGRVRPAWEMGLIVERSLSFLFGALVGV